MFALETTLALIVLTCVAIHGRTTLEAVRCYRAVRREPGAARDYAYAQVRQEGAMLLGQCFSLVLSGWRVVDHDPSMPRDWAMYEAFGVVRTLISVAFAAAVWLTMRTHRRIRREAL